MPSGQPTATSPGRACADDDRDRYRASHSSRSEVHVRGSAAVTGPALPGSAMTRYLRRVAADTTLLRSRSWAERIRRPVLMLHGLDDRTVPPGQTARLRDILHGRHVPHASLTFAAERAAVGTGALMAPQARVPPEVWRRPEGDHGLWWHEPPFANACDQALAMLPPGLLDVSALAPFQQSRLIAPDPDEAGLKETVKANPGQVTVVRVRFSLLSTALNGAGKLVKPQKYVHHCHIVEHEDNDMMERVVVVP
jgi:hypothetical protein